MVIENESEEVEKEIFMRARDGTINISFSTEDDAQKWKEHIASSLKDGGLNVRDE